MASRMRLLVALSACVALGIIKLADCGKSAGILTPYGIRSRLEAKEVDGDSDGEGSSKVRLYEFVNTVPSTPPTILRYGGKAKLHDGDTTVVLHPCEGIVDGDLLYIGETDLYEVSKRRSVVLRGGQDEEPRCTVTLNREWRGGKMSEKIAGFDWRDYFLIENAGHNVGLTFSHSGNGTRCTSIEIGGDATAGEGCQLAGKLDVRQVHFEGEDSGSAIYADLILGNLSVAAIKQNEFILLNHDGAAGGGVTFTTDKGDASLLSAADGKVTVGAKGASPSLVASQGGLQILDKNGTRVFEVDEASNGDVVIGSAGLLSFNAPILEFGNSGLLSFESVSLVGNNITIEGTEQEGLNLKSKVLKVEGDEIFIGDDDDDDNDDGKRPEKKAKSIRTDGDLDLYSRGGLSVRSGKDVTLGGGEGKVTLHDGIMVVEKGSLRSGGLTVNSTGTYLGGTRDAPLIIDSENLEVLVGNGHGARYTNGLGGQVEVASTASLLSLVETREDGNPAINFVSPNSTSALIKFETMPGRGAGEKGILNGYLQFHHGGESHLRSKKTKSESDDEFNQETFFSLNINDRERLRVNSDGSVGVGDFIGSGKLRAPLHIRQTNFVSKMTPIPAGVGLTLEGFQNTITMLGSNTESSHANGIVLGTSPLHTGSPDYWIVSQRGGGDKRFGANSFIIGHSDNGKDIDGEGLDKLDFIEVAVSLGEHGNVGIGCDRPSSSSKLVVGGAIEAARYLLFSDTKFIKVKVEARGADMLNNIEKLKVHTCEYDNSIDGAKAWRNMGNAKEYCVVAQDVAEVDAMLVQNGPAGEKLVKANSLLVAAVGAISGLSGVVNGVAERVGEAEDMIGVLSKDMENADQRETERETRSQQVDGKIDAIESSLQTLKGRIGALEAEMTALKASEKTSEGLRESLLKQVDGYASLLALAEERIGQLEKKVAKVQENAAESEAQRKLGKAQARQSDEEFFLHEVQRLHQSFVDEQDTKVTDGQLKSLRIKWRAEALERLKHRREDLKYFTSSQG